MSNLATKKFCTWRNRTNPRPFVATCKYGLVGWYVKDFPTRPKLYLVEASRNTKCGICYAEAILRFSVTYKFEGAPFGLFANQRESYGHRRLQRRSGKMRSHSSVTKHYVINAMKRASSFLPLSEQHGSAETYEPRQLTTLQNLLLACSISIQCCPFLRDQRTIELCMCRGISSAAGAAMAQNGARRLPTASASVGSPSTGHQVSTKLTDVTRDIAHKGSFRALLGRWSLEDEGREDEDVAVEIVFWACEGP